MEHFVLAIVEAERIPSRVLATFATIEVLAWVTGKVAQTFHFVLHGM